MGTHNLVIQKSSGDNKWEDIVASGDVDYLKGLVPLDSWIVSNRGLEIREVPFLGEGTLVVRIERIIIEVSPEWSNNGELRSLYGYITGEKVGIRVKA